MSSSASTSKVGPYLKIKFWILGRANVQVMIFGTLQPFSTGLQCIFVCVRVSLLVHPFLLDVQRSFVQVNMPWCLRNFRLDIPTISLLSLHDFMEVFSVFLLVLKYDPQVHCTIIVIAHYYYY